MLKKFGIALAVIAVAVVAILPVLFAQERKDDQARTRVPEYEKNITVNYMLVDVIVTDAKGKYVRNLNKDDFELFENGRKMEINSLDEFQMMPSPTGNVREMADTTLEMQHLPRNIIIFFDLLYSSSYGIQRAVDVAEDFVLDRIEPGDRVMVISYYNSLDVVQPFTSDKTKVIQAMKDMGLSSDKGLAHLEAPSGSGAANVPGLSAEQINDEEIGERVSDVQTERLYSQANARNYMMSLDALSSVVKQYPGRKTMILLSEGIDFNLIDPNELNQEDFGPLARQNEQETDVIPYKRPLMSLIPEYKKMLEKLNDSKLSVYSINVSGLNIGGAAEEQYAPADQSTGGQSFDAGMKTINKRQEFLSGIAKDTGGRAYFNTNDIRKLLDNIEVDISNYYILGYRTQINPKKSDYRNITVKVKKPGLTVLHRKGFYTPRPFSSLSSDERDMQLTEGFLTRSQINELDARAGFHFIRSSLDSLSAVVAIFVPAESLQPDKNGERELEVLVSNINDKGEIFSSVHKSYHVRNGEDPDFLKKGIRLVETLDSESGINRLRLALRDNGSGKRTYFYYNYAFRKPAEDTLLLASPMFYKPENMKRTEDDFDTQVKHLEKWDMDKPGGAEMLVNPLSEKIFPLLQPIYKDQDKVSFIVSLFNLQRELKSNDELEFTFAISPVVDEGQKRSYYRVNVNNVHLFGYRGSKGLGLTGDFIIGNLDPGAYDLYVLVNDKVTDRKAASAGQLVLAK